MHCAIKRQAKPIPALTIIFSLFLSTSALAVHDDDGIELDGNVANDSLPNTQADWEDVYDECGTGGPCPPIATGAKRQTFQDDSPDPDNTSFTGGQTAKDTTPISNLQCTTNNNLQGKSDIQFAYGAIYEELGEKILYAGLDRESVNGTSYMGVWLLQAPAGCVSAGGATPFTGQHLDGDLLLVIDYINGGTVTSVNVYRWTDPDFVPENGDECLGGQRGPIGDECANEGGQYFSSVNCDNPDLPNPPLNDLLCGISNGGDGSNQTPANTLSVPWRTDDIGENGFFEMGVNLTAASLADTVSGSECYSSIMIETRSSAELTADLKDFVFLDLATCGSITVEKVTNEPVGDLFDFTIDQPTGADSTTAFQLAGGDSIFLQAVETGDYLFTESALPSDDWSLDDITCTSGQGATDLVAGTVSVTVATEDDIVCTFTNALQPPPGTLTVSKACDSIDDGGETFDFTLTGPTDSLANSSTADCQDGAVTLACGESVSCQDLLPGEYTVDETVPTGWAVTVVNCTGGTGSTCGPAETPHATVNIGENQGVDDTATVAFTDTELSDLTIEKVTIPAAVGGDFAFSPDWDTGFSLAHGQSMSWNDVTPNTAYTVTETENVGYSLASVICTGTNWSANGLGVTVTPDPGEAVTCTFTNTQNPGSITGCKETVPEGSATAFMFELNGPTPGLPSTATLVDGECSDPVAVLVGGPYVITEDPMAGWDLTSATCDNGDNPGNITIDAGEDVLCMFTNTQLNPSISITKSPNSQAIAAGETATWDILVTNTGDVDLANVEVTDAFAPDCDLVIGDLAAGGSSSYSCELLNVQQSFVNVAIVSGDPVGGGDPVSDSDSAVVNLLAPDIAVPVDNKWALLLLALSILGYVGIRRRANR